MAICRSERQNSYRNYPAIGKNQPLKKDHPKWKSEVPLTSGQLTSKRDEFWDTAPAFDGRKEIWDALRAAVQAMENKDQALAQAIINGANITLPNGTLMDCYDELGNHYQLPVYCLSIPVNIVKKDVRKVSQSQLPGGKLQPVNTDDPNSRSLKVRLTSEDEVKLQVLSTDSIAIAKLRLQQQESIELESQRWFFSGKLLTDDMTVEEAKLKKSYVIQCISRPNNNKSSPEVKDEKPEDTKTEGSC